jgi:hypothetical protein
MKTTQIVHDPERNRLNVYQSHQGKKIGEINVSDVSKAFGWNGEAVIDFFLDVLTDCNYHTERREIEEALTIKAY